MKTILSFITTILIFYSTTIKAQTSVHVQGLKTVSSFTTNSPADETFNKIKGSPYYNKEFMFGNVAMYDGKKYNGLFRYNLYSQEMEFIYKYDTLIIDNPIKVKHISFAAKKFAFSVIVQNQWRKNLIYGGYFEVLNQGQCQLLIKYEMDFRLNKYVANYGGGGGDGSYRFIPSEYYFMRLNIYEPAFKFKKSKRFIFKTFQDNKKEISAFMKSDKINMNKRGDLIKLFEYINTL